MEGLPVSGRMHPDGIPISEAFCRVYPVQHTHAVARCTILDGLHHSPPAGMHTQKSGCIGSTGCWLLCAVTHIQKQSGLRKLLHRLCPCRVDHPYRASTAMDSTIVSTMLHSSPLTKCAYYCGWCDGAAVCLLGNVQPVVCDRPHGGGVRPPCPTHPLRLG